jgi:hypothetical protein
VRPCGSRWLSTHLDQAATANCVLAVVFGAPFSESEQLGSHARPAKLMSKPVSPVDVARAMLPARPRWALRIPRAAPGPRSLH